VCLIKTLQLNCAITNELPSQIALPFVRYNGIVAGVPQALYFESSTMIPSHSSFSSSHSQRRHAEYLRLLTVATSQSKRYKNREALTSKTCRFAALLGWSVTKIDRRGTNITPCNTWLGTRRLAIAIRGLVHRRNWVQTAIVALTVGGITINKEKITRAKPGQWNCPPEAFSVSSVIYTTQMWNKQMGNKLGRYKKRI